MRLPAPDPPCCPWCALADLLALLTAHAPPPKARTLSQEGEP
jgi:hypothetical protein